MMSVDHHRRNCGLYSAVLVLVVCSQVIDSCSTGFMSLDVLEKRAEKISSVLVNILSQNDLDGEVRLVPGLTFNCSGKIASLLLGVDVRTVTVNRDEYPEAQLWREDPELSQDNYIIYKKNTSQEIRLAAGDFSPDGVLQYNLTTPIQFQSGDFLGVYQPPQDESIVRLFYANDPKATITYYRNHYIDMVTASDPSTINESMLVIPITDSPQCLSAGFLTPEALRQKTLEVNINKVIMRDCQQRVFPDISFTCNGSITKWIVGAGTGSGSSPSSELQIWRRSGADSYTKVASTQLTAQSPINNSNVYEYVLSSPLGFQEGDILGVYQRENSSVVPYNQESTGPQNLRQPGFVNSAANNLTTPPLATEYDYPLVTVEISSSPTVISLLISSTKGSVIASSVLPSVSKPQDSSLVGLVPISSFSSTEAGPYFTSTIQLSSSTKEGSTIVKPSLPLSTTLVHGNKISSYSTHVASKGAFTDRSRIASTNKATMTTTTLVNDTPLSSTLAFPTLSSFPLTVVVTGGTAAAVIVMCCVALVTIFVMVVIVRRKKKPPITANDEEMKNMYSYQVTEECNNSNVHHVGAKQENVALTSGYLTPGAVLTSADLLQEKQLLSQSSNKQKWGYVVPTMSQRRGFLDSEGYYELYEKGYSTMTQENLHLYKNTPFFEETGSYWQPGKDCVTIYEQLAQKKFMEIIRDQIEIVKHLGSGQFGSVEKGVWHCPGGHVEVAIKTLKKEASEEEKVKFLQEAAINGQFHHPNIVKLHGVVTLGEPIMLILELVKNGDMRQYLRKLRPNPGEMAPPSLPQQLLGYCRQIASGMEYLSKKSFVHRDLAARNILVDDETTCKIADFGMSRDLFDGDYYVSQGGKIPVKWTALEALHYKKYSTASDVWSFGVLMYEIWSLGHKPFEGQTNRQVVNLIDTGYRLSPPPGCPREVYQIMVECWHPETSGRPSFVSLFSRLSQPENQLLKWTDKENSVTHPQSTMLGGPLKNASNLHSDLQQQYT